MQRREACVMFESESRCLVVGDDRIQVSVFDALIAEERLSKLPFFRPPEELDSQTKVEFDDDLGEGFPNMHHCIMMRRKRQGPNQNLSDFKVYDRKTGEFVISAISTGVEGVFILSSKEDEFMVRDLCSLFILELLI